MEFAGTTDLDHSLHLQQDVSRHAKHLAQSEYLSDQQQPEQRLLRSCCVSGTKVSWCIPKHHATQGLVVETLSETDSGSRQ